MLLVCSRSLRAQQADSKLPVPCVDDLNKVRQELRTVYPCIDQASTDPKRVECAETLLKQAEKTLPGKHHYGMLQEAGRLAVEAADAALGFEIIDRMDNAYLIDSYKMRLNTIKSIGKSVNRQTPSQSRALIKGALRMIDEAVGRDDYRKAEQLCRLAEVLALRLARKARDTSWRKQIRDRSAEVKEIAEAYEEVEPLLQILEENPTDPEANRAVGKFLCWMKGDWQKGVPMLALGNDPTLKDLAVKNLREDLALKENKGTLSVQVAVGDGWYEFFEREKKSIAKRKIASHTAQWYKLAQPKLKGFERDKVDQRLGAVEAYLHPASSATKAYGLEFNGKDCVKTNLRYDGSSPVTIEVIAMARKNANMTWLQPPDRVRWRSLG